MKWKGWGGEGGRCGLKCKAGGGERGERGGGVTLRQEIIQSKNTSFNHVQTIQCT